MSDLLEAGVAGAVGGAVQPGGADVLQPGQQLEAEQVAEREPDDARAVGVDVVGFDLGVGAVAQQPSIIAATSEAEQARSWL